MLSLVTALVLLAPDAGAPAKPAPDAGVKVAPPDAGVPEAEVLKVKEQVTDLTTRTSEGLTGLKKRVADLEAKTADLEAKVKRAAELEGQLAKTRDELAAFKREVNEREEERQQRERRAAEARQRFDTATRGLVAADQQLATGSVGTVAEQLRQAEASYTGLALQYVQAARAALANNDLGTARRMLMLAVVEGQFSRPQEIR
jgi:chromosome segregation ATPase